MRWLWYTLLAIGGEYGPAIQQHVVGQVDVVLSPELEES